MSSKNSNRVVSVTARLKTLLPYYVITLDLSREDALKISRYKHRIQAQFLLGSQNPFRVYAGYTHYITSVKLDLRMSSSAGPRCTFSFGVLDYREITRLFVADWLKLSCEAYSLTVPMANCRLILHPDYYALHSRRSIPFCFLSNYYSIADVAVPPGVLPLTLTRSDIPKYGDPHEWLRSIRYRFEDSDITQWNMSASNESFIQYYRGINIGWLQSLAQMTTDPSKEPDFTRRPENQARVVLSIISRLDNYLGFNYSDTHGLLNLHTMLIAPSTVRQTPGRAQQIIPTPQVSVPSDTLPPELQSDQNLIPAQDWAPSLEQEPLPSDSDDDDDFDRIFSVY